MNNRFFLLILHILQAEISLCRVYKRPGVEDHPSLPRTLPTRASTSTTGKRYTHNSLENLKNIGQQTQEQLADDKISDQTSGNSTSTDVGTALGLSYNVNSYIALDPNISTPNCNNNIYSTVSSLVTLPNAIDDLHRLISFQQASVNQHHQQVYQNVDNPNIVDVFLGGSVQAAFPDRIWEWSSITGAATKDYDVPFK